jgi:hypothetical protein
MVLLNRYASCHHFQPFSKTGVVYWQISDFMWVGEQLVNWEISGQHYVMGLGGL